MTDAPVEASPAPTESGTVRWFDAAKKIGVINREDGSTLFIPPYGLARGEGPLGTGQAVTFVVRTNAKGPHAAEVRAAGAAPPTASDIVDQLAQDLGETAPQAIGKIRQIVRHLGPDFARAFVAEAQHLEASGGMLLPDGSRRRTLGGVFFLLVKNALPPEERERIFPPLQMRKQRKAKSPGTEPATPAAPIAPALTWDDRMSLLQSLKEQSGKASTVKVTVIGRPNQIEERPQVTVLTLTHTGPMPALPRGVPVPDPVPATTYSVYIGKKQWKAVAEALQNPEDTLIVEGTQVLDTATGTIAVFASKTTTKLLQQASRQPKPSEDAQG